MEETDPDNWIDLAHLLEATPEGAHHCVQAAFKSMVADVEMVVRFCSKCGLSILDKEEDAENPYEKHPCGKCGEEVKPHGHKASNPLAAYNPQMMMGDKILLTLPKGAKK